MLDIGMHLSVHPLFPSIPSQSVYQCISARKDDEIINVVAQCNKNNNDKTVATCTNH